MLQEINDTIGGLIAQVEELLEQENTAYDNLPESIQNSERGETMQSAIDNMGYLQSSLEEATGYIEEIFNT